MISGYQPDFWHWWILALGLIMLETVLPGTFFLWMGIAALILGVVAWVLPGVGWELQLILFAALSLLSIVGWRFWQSRNPSQSDHPALNRRGEQYIGQVFTLTTAIENGFGKVRVGDSPWRVRGPEAEAGRKVRVTSVDGVILVVDVVEDD